MMTCETNNLETERNLCLVLMQFIVVDWAQNPNQLTTTTKLF